ncbi:MAG: hypothetical protein SFV18_07360 [Bryobacteraceae bacterium]|nr:hypothetical protein [Bryobacteraceae bacterium]
MVEISRQLAEDIDKLVGPRKRSAFIEETIGTEIRRKRFLDALKGPGPIWKDEDHPEFAGRSSDEWVREMRQESEERFRRLFGNSAE